MLKANLLAWFFFFFLGSVLKHNQGFCWVHCEIRLEKLFLLGYSGCVLSKYVKRGGETKGGSEDVYKSGKSIWVHDPLVPFDRVPKQKKSII